MRPRVSYGQAGHVETGHFLGAIQNDTGLKSILLRHFYTWPHRVARIVSLRQLASCNLFFRECDGQSWGMGCMTPIQVKSLTTCTETSISYKLCGGTTFQHLQSITLLSAAPYNLPTIMAAKRKTDEIVVKVVHTFTCPATRNGGSIHVNFLDEYQPWYTLFCFLCTDRKVRGIIS